MEGILLIRMVKKRRSTLGAGGNEDSVLDMVHLRCLQNSQGKGKHGMHLQNESGKEVKAEL